MEETKTNVYPHRPPKKFTKKDLHGRTRFLLLTYNDFKRFQKFYINVFGWDMFELPVAAGGARPGDPNPGVIIASGPSYATWEGVTPGHVNAMATHVDGKVEPPVIMTEVHMDRSIFKTIDEIVAHGGKLIGDKPEETEGWVCQATIADPSGNLHKLWKCPPSRTWEEPEAEYDAE